VKARRANPERYDAHTNTPPKRIRPQSDYKYERWQRQFEQMSAVDLSRYRKDCRSAILAAKRLDVSYTRSDIRYLLDGQKLSFFATHYDRKWLDRYLPSQHGRPGSPKAIERKRTLDEKKRNLVLQRYANTVRDNPERFISRAFLLSETGNESAYKRGTGTPELESTLDQCVDTFDSWSGRQIELVTSMARTVGKQSKWAVRKTFEGLSQRNFSTKLSRAKAWIERNSE